MSQPRSPLSVEDRALLQNLGRLLRCIIAGDPVDPVDTDRLDELGILTSLVNRAANEIALARKRDERQRQELKAANQKLEQSLAEITRAHEQQDDLLQVIRDISTPVLSIADTILLIPLIGNVDDERSKQMMERLLVAVTSRQADTAIIDITGVPLINSQVANILLQTAQAASLLGARVLLCGITPEVAQVIVGLGLDLSGLTPTRDLQTALRMAFQMK